MKGNGFDEFLEDYDPAEYERPKREPVLDPRRVGIYTASEIHKLLSNGKGKDTMGKTAFSYIYQKASEALTGKPLPEVWSPAIQWGKDYELPAIAETEKRLGVKFEKTGKQQEFILSENGIYGGTPDGVCPHAYMGIEAHCPNSFNHLRYRGCDTAEKLKHENPQKYWQIQCLLHLSEYISWYFVSYDPRILREDFRLHILRIEPNLDDIAAMLERIHAADEIKRRITETGII